MDSHASVWPLELGIRTPGWGNGVNRSTVFALHCFVLPCVRNMMQGVGLLDFTLGYSTIVYLTFLFAPSPPLALVQRLNLLHVKRRVASVLLLPALTPSSLPWIRFGNPETLCGLFMCTICRLVQRLLYIKDVSLPCMTLMSL